jgi:hypothetical protein
LPQRSGDTHSHDLGSRFLDSAILVAIPLILRLIIDDGILRGKASAISSLPDGLDTIAGTGDTGSPAGRNNGWP